MTTIEQLVEALKMLLSYTVACEGLLNAKPAGQINIAKTAIAAGEAELKREPTTWRVSWPRPGGGYTWLLSDCPMMQEHNFVNEPLWTREEIK